MLFFVAERPHDSISAQLLEGLTDELAIRRIEHGIILVMGGGVHSQDFFTLRHACTSEDDIWLCNNGFSTSASLLKEVPGRKYAFLSYVPHRGAPIDESLARRQLEHFDAIFVDNRWAQHRLLAMEPRLADRIVISGFPLDVDQVRAYAQAYSPSPEPTVIIAEPFTPAFGHLLKVETARRLLEHGITTRQIVWGTREEFFYSVPMETRTLYLLAEAIGMRFVFCTTTDTYYTAMGEARCLLSTAPAFDQRCLTNALEALCLGVPVLVPESGWVPAGLPVETYPSLKLDDVVARLRAVVAGTGAAPDTHEQQGLLAQLFTMHSKSAVVDRVLARLSADAETRMPLPAHEGNAWDEQGEAASSSPQVRTADWL